MRIRTIATLGFGAAAGAGAMYLLDPEHGRQRRAQARRDAVARAQEGLTDAATRVAVETGPSLRRLADQAKGGFYEALPDIGREQPNDATLIQKVKSEVFGSSPVPMGAVSVDACAGVITLRGEIPSAREILDLESATRRVRGVVDVTNLLHRPGEPIPSVDRSGGIGQ